MLGGRQHSLEQCSEINGLSGLGRSFGEDAGVNGRLYARALPSPLRSFATSTRTRWERNGLGRPNVQFLESLKGAVHVAL